MIRINNQSSFFDGAQYIEGACNSSDTKPTDGVATGSVLIEVDTGKVFFYNGDTSAWVEQFSFQS